MKRLGEITANLCKRIEAAHQKEIQRQVDLLERIGFDELAEFYSRDLPAQVREVPGNGGFPGGKQ